MQEALIKNRNNIVGEPRAEGKKGKRKREKLGDKVTKKYKTGEQREREDRLENCDQPGFAHSSFSSNP